MYRKRNVGGRPKMQNPSKHRYSFNLNDEENAKFLAMFEASGMSIKARFITSVLFNKPIKVVKIDKGAHDYIIRLTQFYAQFRAVGVNYNQTTKAIKSIFTERKALAFLSKLVSATWELVRTNKQIMDLTKEFQDKYLSGEVYHIYPNDKAE